MLATPTIRTIDPPALALPDLDRLLDRADLPGHVEAALEAASDAARAVIEQLPGQRRRRRHPAVVAGLLAGSLAVAGGAAWLLRRWAVRRSELEALAEEHEFDRDARERATDEGMTGLPVIPDGALPSVEASEWSPSGDAV